MLGSMILEPACIGDIIKQLKTEDFYRIENQLIFSALVALWERAKNPTAAGIDIVLLRDELRKTGRLEEVGGVGYIAQIVQSLPTAANAEYYAKIVKDKTLLRQMIQVGTDIVANAYEQDGISADAKLDLAEQKIFALADRRTCNEAKEVSVILPHLIDEIDERANGNMCGLSTGFGELDNLTLGLHCGEMIIIAGRPSMGKTAFALNIAAHIGIKNKIPAAFFSMEMTSKSLVERILCNVSELNSQDVRKGELSDDEREKLVNGACLCTDAPIFIDDTPSLTPLVLRAKTRRLKAKHDIKIVFVDYIQLMAGTTRAESRLAEVTAISSQIKALARELGIPVVVLSQLNRAAEAREDHRPRLSDLRESGAIEQDADVVILLHREDYYHRSDPAYCPTGLAEVIIAKHRNGPVGTVELRFNGALTRFENR